MEFTSRIECGLDQNYLTDRLWDWCYTNGLEIIFISVKDRESSDKKVKLRAIRSFPGEILLLWGTSIVKSIPFLFRSLLRIVLTIT